MPDEPRERPFILQWRSAVLNAPLTGTQKLCLLVLAEWADADGTNCWPAMEKIADKASVNEKTVRRSMDDLAPMGWFVRSHRRTQKGWKQFEYTLRLPDAADTVSCRTDDVPDTTPTAKPNAADTVSAIGPASTGHSDHLHRTLTSDAPGTVSTDLALPSQDLSQKEVPPPEKKVTRAKKQVLTFAEWNDSLPDEENAIPKTDPVFDYAEQIGIPYEVLKLHWLVFADKYRDRPKRYKDWRAVYRESVKANWYDIWYFDDAKVCQLTRKGVQHELFHQAGVDPQSRHPDPAVARKLVA